MVAVFNSELYTREINIAGDAVWAVVNTPNKTDIDDVFRLAYTANTLMELLNVKMKNAGYDAPLRAGIGASWGRALMIKAGYNGSGINDVVYMGDVVNEAAHLAANGSKTPWDDPVMVSSDFHGNLNDHNRSLLAWNARYRCYSGSVVQTGMHEWVNAQ